jgi:hypothetical protein
MAKHNDDDEPLELLQVGPESASVLTGRSRLDT